MRDYLYECLAQQEWDNQENHSALFDGLKVEFERMVNECNTTASYAQKTEQTLLFWRSFWKVMLIVLTGIIASINLFASSNPELHCLPIVSAILAVTVSTLASIDSFLNYAVRAKEAGDLFRSLRDAAFRYKCHRANYVTSVGATYGAYRNAFYLNMDFCDEIDQARAAFKAKKNEIKKNDGDNSAAPSGSS